MIKTAVIGFGLSARIFHLPFIAASDRFKLVGISTRSRAQIETEWPKISWYPTGEELIRKTDADLIIVTAPNAAHFSLAALALAQGKHVIIEKPMVTSVLEGKALSDLANQGNQVLSVFHNRRWDGDFLTIKQLIQKGSMGRVKYFESRFDRFSPQVQDRWREQPGAGSGNWFDLGSHLADQCLCLFGMPRAVTARCSCLRDNSKAIDYFHVMLHYPDHEAVLHGSPFSQGPVLRFQVQGTRGSFIKYSLDPQEEQLKAGMTIGASQWAREDKNRFGTLYAKDGAHPVPTVTGGYEVYFSGIAHAIQTGSPPPVSAQDGIRVVHLLELALQSSESGRTVLVEPFL